jgi:hypothetical protein
MADLAELTRIYDILEKNKHKNFVKRILDPDNSPKLDLGEGNYATHKMAWGESEGKYFVYPTIIQDGDKLVDYGKDAFNKAFEKGDVIEFSTPYEADNFSKNYKKVWEKR